MLKRVQTAAVVLGTVATLATAATASGQTTLSLIHI